jgi:hypothetical protein
MGAQALRNRDAEKDEPRCEACASLASECEDYWQQVMDRIYEARAISAQREIARHQDLVALLRPRLVGRSMSFRVAPLMAKLDLGRRSAPGRQLRRFGRQARAVLVTARRSVEHWGQSLQIRK